MKVKKIQQGRFFEVLNRVDSEIKDDRVKTILEDAERIYVRSIEDLRAKTKTLMMEQDNILDLSSNGMVPIPPASEFNAVNFVQKDSETAFRIVDCKLSLEIIEARFKQLFGKEA
jgi:hypothetical protein